MDHVTAVIHCHSGHMIGTLLIASMDWELSSNHWVLCWERTLSHLCCGHMVILFCVLPGWVLLSGDLANSQWLASRGVLSGARRGLTSDCWDWLPRVTVQCWNSGPPQAEVESTKDLHWGGEGGGVGSGGYT